MSARVAPEWCPRTGRVACLPWRDWHDTAPVDALTALLRTPGSTAVLRPFQAACLAELRWLGGVVGVGRVGVGKTLVAGLAVTVMGARKPLLLVPANGGGKAKALRELREYAKEWRIDVGAITIRTYQWLGREANAGHLAAAGYDLIICDESQWLKNARRDGGSVSAVALRVCEYAESERGRSCAFVFLSASVTSSGSTLEFGHLIAIALRDNAPVPLTVGERDAWQCAIDGTGPSTVLLGAGTPEDAELRFGARFRSAPGVVVTTDVFDGPLTITPVVWEPPRSVEPHWARLRNLAQAPDEWMLGDRMQTFGFARRLAREFYTRHDPRPPRGYILARQRWAGVVRTLIECGWADSEGHAVRVLPEPFRPVLAEWLQWRAAHPMTLVYEQLADDLQRACATWARARPGIVWVHGAEFGAAVAARAGIPYYGLNSKGAIMREDGTRSVVASISACGTAFNLQRFHRNLIAHWTGDDEQLLGRTHREGQREPVTVEWVAACYEDLAAYRKMLQSAAAVQRLTGQPQKILTATTVTPPPYSRPGPSAAWEPKAIREDQCIDD